MPNLSEPPHTCQALSYLDGIWCPIGVMRGQRSHSRGRGWTIARGDVAVPLSASGSSTAPTVIVPRSVPGSVGGQLLSRPRVSRSPPALTGPDVGWQILVVSFVSIRDSPDSKKRDGVVRCHLGDVVDLDQRFWVALPALRVSFPRGLQGT